MPDPIEEFFGGYPPDVQAISRKLRAMVNAAMPDSKETLYANQNHLGYSATGSYADRIVYICMLKDYVRLGFMWGAHLPDPNQILVGDGKRLRHVKVYTLKEAEKPAREKLVVAAWADAPTRIKKKA